MKTTLILLSFFWATTFLFAQKQTNSNVISNTIPPKSESEKNQWITENPQKYKEAGGQFIETKIEERKINISESQAKSSNPQMNIPSEPEFINTGHPKMDHINYTNQMKEWIQKMEAINKQNGVFDQGQRAKEIWIKANPKLYNPNN